MTTVPPPFVEGQYIDVPCKGVWIHENQPRFKYDEETMYNAFERNVKNIPEREFLGERYRDENGVWGPYEWITQKEAGEIVSHLGSALVNELHEERNAPIGICSPNCSAWILAQYAMYRQGMTPVPLYPTLGESSIAFILEQTEAKIVFCGSKSVDGILKILFSQTLDCDIDAAQIEERAKDEKAAAAKTGKGANEVKEGRKYVSHVKTIVAMDRFSAVFPPLPEEIADELARRGIKTKTWCEMVAAGKAHPADPTPARAEELYGIVYTSGSTGTPKGVMLTHKNVCNAVDIMYSAPQFSAPIDNWRYLSYLPLAHSMELELTSIMIKGRGQIGFCSTVANIFDDMAILRPDFFPTVPRIWKKFYDKVNEVISQSYVRRMVFDLAYAAKKNAMLRGTTTWINWDSLVFNPIASKLGGRIKICMCAAAPLDAGIVEWLKVVCGIQIYQVYGLTECFGGLIAQVPPHLGDNDSVGIPMDHSEVRLVDVPEMNYTCTDSPPRGEIVVRAPNVFKGYYKEPGATAEVLTEDGWFYTGDCARFNPDGTMTIIDRKKNIFKLSQGEYVPVEMVELTYSYSPYISQIWVWGNSNDSFLVAVVVPDPDYIRRLAADVFLTDPSIPSPETADIADLCRVQEINRRVLEELAHVGRERKLKGYEIVRGIILEPVPWEPATEVMTPTLKVKRPQMYNRYRTQLEELCKKIRAENTASSSSSSDSKRQASSSSSSSLTENNTPQQKNFFMRILGF